MAYVGKGTEDSTAFGTSLSPDIPADLANNDILILVCVNGATGDTFTWPNGYTEGGQGSVAGSTEGWCWKRSDGSDVGTETVTSTENQQFLALIFAMRGYRTAGNPFDTKDATYGSGASTSTHEIETSEANCQVLSITAVEDDTGVTVDDNYTEHFEVLNQDGNDTGIAVWYQDKAVAGTVGAEGITFGAFERWGTWTFDLVPAGAPPAGGITVLSTAYSMKRKKEQNGVHIPGLI